MKYMLERLKANIQTVDEYSIDGVYIFTLYLTNEAKEERNDKAKCYFMKKRKKQ